MIFSVVSRDSTLSLFYFPIPTIISIAFPPYLYIISLFFPIIFHLLPFPTLITLTFIQLSTINKFFYILSSFPDIFLISHPLFPIFNHKLFNVSSVQFITNPNINVQIIYYSSHLLIPIKTLPI